jgi:uncharacterized protein with PIN domain
MPPAAPAPHLPADPRFAADAMLARLARWLRTLGFDTTLDPELADPDLVRHADEEHRVLLTRDRLLLRDLRPRRAIEVHDDAPLAQLRQVVTTQALPPPAELFTRCTVCNTPLSAPLEAAQRECCCRPTCAPWPAPRGSAPAADASTGWGRTPGACATPSSGRSPAGWPSCKAPGTAFAPRNAP